MDAQVSEVAAEWAVILLTFGVGSFFFGYDMYIRLGYSKQCLLRVGSGFFGPRTYGFLPLVGAVSVVLSLTAPLGGVETLRIRPRTRSHLAD